MSIAKYVLRAAQAKYVTEPLARRPRMSISCANMIMESVFRNEIEHIDAIATLEVIKDEWLVVKEYLKRRIQELQTESIDR